MERIFVRFPSASLKLDVLSGSAFGRRLTDETIRPKVLYSQPDVMVTAVADEDRNRLEQLGAKTFDDVQFRVLPGHEDDHDDWDDAEDARPWIASESMDPVDQLSLKDVVEQVNAPEAWTRTRGEGATIVVIDTGISDLLKEIPAARRHPLDLASEYAGQHWQDSQGHGSMCAAVAAGSSDDGGRYDGIAPGAKVVAARSSLRASDLADIYDELIRARDGDAITGPIVVTNSYGLYVCSPPNVLPEDHPYIDTITTAIGRGLFVCFAAGNNHYNEVCGHDPDACGPNTIWGPNSHDLVISVGTVNRDLTNRDPLTPHANSSRGPGEWARHTIKPDCVAPTYGEVPWGSVYRRMHWWGTSGACPQVAGLAALVLSVNPALTPADVGTIIKDTCSLLPEGKTCVGRGVIDCAAAVDEAHRRLATS